MTEKDFDNIRYFSPAEITATGAKLADVKYTTIAYLDRVRGVIGKPFRLLSLTTGKHKAKEHPNGMAVDFTVDHIAEDEITSLVYQLLFAGFRGIGVYKNGHGVYSFHADTRAELATWYGTKRVGEKSWKMGKLRLDL